MSKTVCFITRNFGKYDPDSLRGYESIGGFRALRKALTMEGYAIADVLAVNQVPACRQPYIISGGADTPVIV